MISNVEIPLPVQYLPTGDHGLLVAWVQDGRDLPGAVLCLEDGSAVSAWLFDIKFDYRYDSDKGVFVDVSGFGTEEEEGSGDSDQGTSDHGSEAVPG